MRRQFGDGSAACAKASARPEAWRDGTIVTTRDADGRSRVRAAPTAGQRRSGRLAGAAKRGGGEPPATQAENGAGRRRERASVGGWRPGGARR
ncbi:MAG: hypothetical protein PHR35_16530 [Kiritimatiellae bacterium]|nr:hypothetical protein [Kiritimatiellia bacterium]